MDSGWEVKLAAMRSRWFHLTLLAVLLMAMGPTPVPIALVEHVEAARTAGAWGEPASALAHMEAAMRLEPALAGLHLPAARAALAAGDLHSALRHLALAQGKNVPAGEVACLRIQAFLSAGAWERAFELWRAKESPCPNDQPMLRGIAQGLIEQSAFSEAEEPLLALLDSQPQEGWCQLQLGLLRSVRDPQAALGPLREAEALLENDELARDLLRTIEESTQVANQAYTLAQVGATLARHNRWQLARRALQTAVEADPSYAEAWAYYGLATDRAGGDGLRALNHATQLDPSSTTAHLFLGMHWLSHGAAEAAIPELERAARLEPENPTVAAQLGEAYVALGDLSTALEAYAYAASLAPEIPTFWLLLSQVSLSHEVQVRSVGLPAARHALALDPGNPAALDAMGYAYYLLGDVQLARRFLLRGVEIDPDSSRLQYHLGLVWMESGSHAQARAAFERANRMEPEGPIGTLSELAIESMSR